jgi:hypothetical protein
MAHESKQVYDCELKTIGKKLRITLVENEDRIPSIKSIFLFMNMNMMPMQKALGLKPQKN